MNIQITAEILNKLGTIEKLLWEIDSDIVKISPNTYSTTMCKDNILKISRNITILHDDIVLFKEGKSIQNAKEVIDSVIKDFKRKIEDKDSGPDDIFPPFK